MKSTTILEPELGDVVSLAVRADDGTVIGTLHDATVIEVASNGSGRFRVSSHDDQVAQRWFVEQDISMWRNPGPPVDMSRVIERPTPLSLRKAS